MLVPRRHARVPGPEACNANIDIELNACDAKRRCKRLSPPQRRAVAACSCRGGTRACLGAKHAMRTHRDWKLAMRSSDANAQPVAAKRGCCRVLVPRRHACAPRRKACNANADTEMTLAMRSSNANARPAEKEGLLLSDRAEAARVCAEALSRGCTHVCRGMKIHCKSRKVEGLKVQKAAMQMRSPPHRRAVAACPCRGGTYVRRGAKLAKRARRDWKLATRSSDANAQPAAKEGCWACLCRGGTRVRQGARLEMRSQT